VVADEYADHLAGCLDADDDSLGDETSDRSTAAPKQDRVRFWVYSGAVVFLVLLTTCYALGYQSIVLWLGGGLFFLAWAVKFFATFIHPVLTWWRGERTTRSGKDKSSGDAW
jgi:hypothetical protein